MARKQKKEKVNKWKLPKEEAKIQAREKRIRRSFRVTRLRALKNFLYWFFGVLSSIGIIFGGIFLCVGVIPVSTLVGKDTLSEYVSSNVSDKSILNVILGMGDFTFDDFPIIESSLKDALGEDNDISVFNDYQKTDTPTLIAEGNRYKYSGDDKAENFYYKTTGALTRSTDTATASYAKAFDDNGYLLETLNAKYADGTLELFYPPLFDLPVVEGLSSIGKYISFFELTDLLKLVLGDEYEEGSVIDNAFSGMTIGDMTANEEDEGFGDKIMKKLSLDSLGVNDFGDLGDQKFFSEYEKVPVTDYPETLVDGTTQKETIKKDGEEFTKNPKLFYIELKADVPATADAERVDGEYERAFNDDGEFIADFEVDGEKLDTLAKVQAKGLLCYADLSRTSLSNTFELLDESLDRASISTLALGDYEENQKMYDIILSAKNKMPVQEPGESDDDYKARVKAAAEALKMEDLENLDTDAVKLTVVLPYKEANEDGAGTKKLYDILVDVTGQTKENITIGHLNDFDSDNIKLVSVLPYSAATETSSGTEKLYKILMDVKETDDYNTITVGGLSEFDTDKIKLNSVISSSSNKIINALISDQANPVTIGTISTRINDMKLYDIYGESCFTEATNGAFTKETVGGKVVFRRVGSGGTHNISSSSSIWLLLCFDIDYTNPTEYDTTNAQVLKYTSSSTSMSTLENDDSNIIGSAILDAKISVLLDAGIVTRTGLNVAAKNKSINDLIDGL